MVYPLVVIELKSASDENVGIEEAYNQIQRYKRDIPSLFNYNGPFASYPMILMQRQEFYNIK